MADIADSRYLMRRKTEQSAGKRVAEREDRIEERRRNRADKHGPPGPLRPFRWNACEPKREQGRHRGRHAHVGPEIDPVQIEIHPPEKCGQYQCIVYLSRCGNTRCRANTLLTRPCANSRPRGSSIPAMSSSPNRKWCLVDTPSSNTGPDPGRDRVPGVRSVRHNPGTSTRGNNPDSGKTPNAARSSRTSYAPTYRTVYRYRAFLRPSNMARAAILTSQSCVMSWTSLAYMVLVTRHVIGREARKGC